MSGTTQLILGLLLGLAIAGGGYWKRALSVSGAGAAAIVGAGIFALGGWAWGVLLVAFFIASSALSFYNERAKAEVATEKFAKGSRRDWAQVVANGGWALLLALLMWRQPSYWLFPALVGALATVTADTWATELGIFNRQPPRLITTWQPVPPGTNGAISTLGTLAALVGGLFIGTVAYPLVMVGGAPYLLMPPLWLPSLAAISGLAGAMVDSLLGATVQRVYLCPRCDSETERPLHHCGTATHPLRGWQWMDNDMVNFLSSVAGSAVGAWLGLLLSG